jgi:hypothetical protein
MAAEGPPIAALTARARALQQTAESLLAAFRQPAMRALVTDATTNLREAQRWFDDARLEASDTCRLWVEAILTVTARRLATLDETLRRHGPDVNGLSG